LSDVARCVLNTKELPPKEGEPRAFALEWEKLSDAPKPLPLMFTITDLSTGPDNLHLRRIEWGISREEAEKIVADLEKSHEGKGGANG
jgi:hypothetical protein